MPPGLDINGNGWLKAVATVGLPSVLALILTGFLVYNVVDAHAKMAVQLERVEQAVVDNGRILGGMTELIRVSRQTCLNTAADAAARARCLE